MPSKPSKQKKITSPKGVEGEAPIRLSRLEGAYTFNNQISNGRVRAEHLENELKSGTTPAPYLETFPNPEPKRPFEIAFTCPEFTCVCPKTGQPDFATIKIRYIPQKTCVELKSLKLYLWSYRNEGAFHEKVTNQILNDLVTATKPKFMEVIGDFYVRGGIHTVVTVRHGKTG